MGDIWGEFNGREEGKERILRFEEEGSVLHIYIQM
jgi:hypothetical protein